MADNPVIPGYTPGSAMADQLQQILTSKRVEARQAMLDQIHAKDIESQIRDRDENARTNAEIRAANAENRKSQADTRFLTTLGDNPRNLDPTTATKLAEIDPSRLESVQGGATLPSTKSPMAGLIVGGNTTKPISTTSTIDPSAPDPSVPSTQRYLGSPAYMKQHEVQTKLESLGPNFSQLPPEQQLMKIAAIFPGTDPMAVLERLLTAKSQQAPGRFKVWSEAQQKMIDAGAIGPNDKTAMEPRSPREPKDHGTFLDRPVIIDGKVDPHKVYVMKNGDITIQNVPDGASLGNKPNAKVPIVSSQEAAQYAKFRGLATKEPDGFIFNSAGVKVKNSVAFSQYEQSLYGKFPPDISGAVKAALEANLPSTTTNEDLVKQALEQGSIVPGEEQSFYSLLQTVR